MKKKLIRIAIILPCAVIALGILASLLSHAVYGRTLRASVYEVVLRRRYANPRTPEEEVARLEAKRDKGEKPYALPDDLKFSVPIEAADRDGTQVFVLNGDAPRDVIALYLHGGAYINPFNAYQWRFMDRLAAEADCPVVAPAYRLAPFATYADAYADLTALYRDLLDKNPDSRIALMGDSAGGGLALGLAEYWRDEGLPLPDRLILFSPWVDVSMDNSDILPLTAIEPILHLELVKLHGIYWAGGQDTHHWQVSPLYGDMEGLPPVTLYCGTRELLLPDISLAADKLAAAGNDVDLHVARGLNHDYPLMPIPDAEPAVREAIAIVKALEAP